MCAVVDERNQRAQLTSDVKSYNSSLHGFTIGVQELVSLLNGCRSDIKMLQEDLESYSESPNEVAGPSSFPLSAQAIQVPGILAIGAGTYAQI